MHSAMIKKARLYEIQNQATTNINYIQNLCAFKKLTKDSVR